MEGTPVLDPQPADSGQIALGAIVAQQAIDSIRTGAPPVLAWLRLIELQQRHGRHDASCAAFVIELAKRAAR